MLRKHATILRVFFSVLSALAVLGGIINSVKQNTYIPLLYISLSVAITLVLIFALAAFFDTTADNSELLEEINKNLAPADSSEDADHPLPAVTPKSNGDGYITCPQCGERQSANRTICFNCSARFKADSPFPRKPSEAPAYSAPAAASPVAPQAVKEGYVVCPKCGTVQRAGRQVCFNCSTRFE